MDFFYLSTYVNGFTPGLQNAYIGGTYNPLKDLTLAATYHYLATGTDLDGLNKTLGHEVELEASYTLAKDIKVSAGYSYMTGTETMERLKRASGDGSLRWAWLSLNITPRIFSAKW
jgi:predicted porin